MDSENTDNQLNENINTSEDLHEQNHKHGFFSHFHGHSHTHGKVDPSTLATSKGLRVLKWSFIGMMITAILQVVIVSMSGSVALLADTIHNFGDAATAIPLAIAFYMANKKPSKSFSYGYGRLEDIAGVIIVLLILFSA
ncbi:MAG TPA: cation transporter, partial [Clostridiaceae bacterium]|nr:cation transporter [Clostridiaceae bacterium]